MAAKDIEVGTDVYTDKGAAFNHVKKIVGGQHKRVNHSKHLVDPDTGVHTNHVEGANALVKRFLKAKGNAFARNDGVLWRNINHYLWQRWYTDGSLAQKFSYFFLSLFDQVGFM